VHIFYKLFTHTDQITVWDDGEDKTVTLYYFYELVYSKISMVVSQNKQPAYILYLNSYVTVQIYLQRYTIRLFYFFSLVQDMNGTNKYKPTQTNVVRCVTTLVIVRPKWVTETNIYITAHYCFQECS